MVKRIRRIIKKMTVAQTGFEATKLLNNPVVQKAFDEMEKGLLDEWKDTKPKDIEGRESLWSAYRYLERFKHLLTCYVLEAEHEKMAEKEKEKSNR